MDGDGASLDNNLDQFDSPPQSPVSSSYSPLPSPPRDQNNVGIESAALRAAAVALLLEGPPSQVSVSTDAVIVNLEEAVTVEDATCEISNEPNNMITLAQVVTDHHDTECLRRYQQVVMAVRCGHSEYKYQREVKSLLQRVSRSAPRMATFQSIRAVVNHFHGSREASLSQPETQSGHK